MFFLIALVTGALSALAFQPMGWWPLMILAIALLCELVSRADTLKRALLIGWLFGLGQFAIGLNWIATAFTFQAAMPAWLGWVAVFLLSLYLAIYPAMAAGLAWRFGDKHRLALVLALAGGWAITEWLRATMFTGFAWNPIGVVLADTPWLNSATFIGTYGLSLVTAVMGGAVWLLGRREWRGAAAIAASAGLLVALPKPIIPAECCLRAFDARPTGKTLSPAAPISPKARALPTGSPPPEQVGPHSALVTGSVRIVQPNISQADKWREGFDVVTAQRMELLSTRPYGRGEFPADTLFWPEAAVTNPLADERLGAASEVAFERLRAARSLVPGQLLATGGLGLASSDGHRVDGATNSVFVLDSGGRIVGRYDKAHLVPYGEYLPMRPILSAIGLSRLAPGDLDFRPGPGPRTLELPNGRKMGVQICYEIIFSGQVVDPRNRPDHIFNPSNDAWFGAWGPPQHLAQARLRAAEEALPIIRATPTGVSAVIDASGQLLRSIPAGPAKFIDSGMPVAGPPTLFAKTGNIIPLALGSILLVVAIALSRRRRYSAI